MDVKEFLEIISNECGECKNCRYYNEHDEEWGCEIERVYLEGDNIDKVIEIGEEIKANRKTYRDDFLSKFPNAMITFKGAVAGVCRNKVYDVKSACKSCVTCWNEEYKGE